MIVCDPNSLYHHGVLGMKWGVRRYQRKDGSLTPAGRKHLAKVKEKHAKTGEEIGRLERHDTRPQAAKDRDVLKKKAKNMSNEELAQAISRIRQEQTYESLINPPKEQQKNQFLEKGKKTVTDLIWEESKKVAANKIENKAGINLDPNAMRTLKELGGDLNKMSDKQFKAYAERVKTAQSMKDGKYNYSSGITEDDVRRIFEEERRRQQD